ncbi:hypothetical protein [Caulobacter sp. X]|uniref:hypothetical protein n=1 Tax=Caulobacter sp. X TaxID=2048901 RepID=UPI00191BC04A|nr:hypothetical protein [Caulobacter sp. X]
MVDAEISFSPTDIALSPQNPRMAPLAGLGLAVATSASLWALLALGLAWLL